MRTEYPRFEEIQQETVAYTERAINDMINGMVIVSDMGYEQSPMLSGSNPERILSKRLRALAERIENNTIKLEAVLAAQDLVYTTKTSVTFTEEGVEGVISGTRVDMRKTSDARKREDTYNAVVCGTKLKPEEARELWYVWANPVREIYINSNLTSKKP